MSPIIGITTQIGEKGEEGETLYGVRPYYPDAIRQCGGIPILVPLGASTKELSRLMELCDGFLIPGGIDIEPKCYSNVQHPKVIKTSHLRDELDIPVIRNCYENGKPALGICRGMQMMNVALGGTLWQDIPSEFPSDVHHSAKGETEWTDLIHEIAIGTDTKLNSIYQTNKRPVNSLHHQGVSECSKKLIASAKAPDGLIEAVEAPDHKFFLGVQWHPEALLGNDVNNDLELFKAFVRSCGR